MPKAIYHRCAVKVNQSQIYLIGGHYHEDNGGGPQRTDEVYIFNPLDNFSVIQGPSLLNAREKIQCAVMHDGDTSKIVVMGPILGGSWDSPDIEILDISQNQWKVGKKKKMYIQARTDLNISLPYDANIKFFRNSTRLRRGLHRVLCEEVLSKCMPLEKTSGSRLCLGPDQSLFLYLQFVTF